MQRIGSTHCLNQRRRRYLVPNMNKSPTRNLFVRVPRRSSDRMPQVDVDPLCHKSKALASWKTSAKTRSWLLRRPVPRHRLFSRDTQALQYRSLSLTRPGNPRNLRVLPPFLLNLSLLDHSPMLHDITSLILVQHLRPVLGHLSPSRRLALRAAGVAQVWIVVLSQLVLQVDLVLLLVRHEKDRQRSQRWV